MKPKTLRQALEKKLSIDDLSLLKKSYDIMGNLLVIEIPDELKKKEKVIGEALLNMHKAVETVCKRVGMHSGVFRAQKLKVIAGKKTKIATFKENGVTLTLDAESVYFSARSATERKRIASLVKKGESVLVMFSGCAPFVAVIAKNTKAKEVYGIELNPAGHYYGQINMRQNKLHNTSLILGDVRKVIPDFYKYIIGLKSSIDDKELIKRIQKNPGILELHLFNKDLFVASRFAKIERTIKKLQKHGVQVVLHQPFGYKDDSPFNFGAANVEKEFEMVKKLGSLCRKFRVKAVLHPYTQNSPQKSVPRLIENLRKLKRYAPYFMFENVTLPPFNSAPKIISIGKKAGIQNIVIDLAHFMIMKKSTKKVAAEIIKLQKEFNTYFHISDSDGKDQAMDIGKGKINFKQILPFVNQGIIEVRSKDELHPKEMLRSYDTVMKLPKTFDRIVMPLPKSAKNFLASALLASKKGTVIHCYDFLEEKEFSKTKKEIQAICRKSGKKVKIKSITKCGNFSPGVFRVSIDILVE